MLTIDLDNQVSEITQISASVDSTQILTISILFDRLCTFRWTGLRSNKDLQSDGAWIHCISGPGLGYTLADKSNNKTMNNLFFLTLHTETKQDLSLKVRWICRAKKAWDDKIITCAKWSGVCTGWIRAVVQAHPWEMKDIVRCTHPGRITCSQIPQSRSKGNKEESVEMPYCYNSEHL